MNFSKDFLWGVATASYQIEGAVNEDGRCLSIWDIFSKTPYHITDNSNADITCDHYHRYKEDVKLIKDLGAKAYRFSVAWPRIFSYDSDTRGGAVKGKLNQKGLDFYNRLIDELLDSGITPFLTLYHWDLPLELENKGGWRNRDIHNWISDYTRVIAENFSDRVKDFFTLNEMPCILGGYRRWFAPGLEVSHDEYFKIIHHMLLAHGSCVKTLREASKQKVNIGCAHNGLGNYPATDSKEDYEAFIKAMNCIEGSPDSYSPKEGSRRLLGDSLIYYLDPVHFGKYPDKAFEIFKDQMPQIKDGDMELISTPVDYQGINIYEGRPIASGSAPGKNDGGWHVAPFPLGKDITAAKWPITPKSMNHYFKFIYDRYKKPIYVSENGMSNADIVSLDGKCHDPQRIDFMQRYLTELKKAIDSGADIRGYFHWSLLDNYEWRNGFTERFGLVHVDYETQKRTPKDSYFWYKDLITR